MMKSCSCRSKRVGDCPSIVVVAFEGNNVLSFARGFFQIVEVSVLELKNRWSLGNQG